MLDTGIPREGRGDWLHQVPLRRAVSLAMSLALTHPKLWLYMSP